MIDEHDAVRVVDFVLEHAGEEAIGFESDFVAINVEGFDADAVVAPDFAVKPVDAETPFVILVRATFAFDNFRVDKRDEFLDGFVVKVAAHDDDPLETVDLDSGKGCTDFVRPGILPVETRVGHVLDELACLIGHDVHTVGLLSEMRIWEGDDSFFFH